VFSLSKSIDDIWVLSSPIPTYSLWVIEECNYIKPYIVFLYYIDYYICFICLPFRCIYVDLPCTAATCTTITCHWITLKCCIEGCTVNVVWICFTNLHEVIAIQVTCFQCWYLVTAIYVFIRSILAIFAIRIGWTTITYSIGIFTIVNWFRIIEVKAVNSAISSNKLSK
jgi:hypothetical protein